MRRSPAAAAPRSPAPVRTTLNMGASSSADAMSRIGRISTLQTPGIVSQKTTSSSCTGVPTSVPNMSEPACVQVRLMRLGSVTQSPAKRSQSLTQSVHRLAHG